MSPAWFIAGVVLFYFQAVDGAVKFGGPQPSPDHESTYYCPAEMILEKLAPGPSSKGCTEDKQCAENQKCCTAVVVDDDDPKRFIRTFSRCIVPEKKSVRGFCPDFKVPFELIRDPVPCTNNGECEHLGKICCFNGLSDEFDYIQPKSCMIPQSDPPIKFIGQQCPSNDGGSHTACATDYGCTGQNICCGGNCLLAVLPNY